MDQDVIAAMARWPNVPAVYGWLSLDARGRWRLHPAGNAQTGGPGEPIGNPAIQAYMARNYAGDPQGRWFFQNGPQRVYVRLDAAPLIVRLAADGAKLAAHTGQPIGQVTQWWLEADGRLFAATDAGPALIEDRDLAGVLDRLRCNDGTPLADRLASAIEGELTLRYRDHPAYDAPLATMAAGQAPAKLCFDANPNPGA